MFPALIQELDSAIADGTPPRRAKTLARITDIFVAGSDNYSANQIELVDDVFVRIAAVIEQTARVRLANRLAKMPRAPAMINRVLASDDEIDVAGPVLEQSQQLNNENPDRGRTNEKSHRTAQLACPSSDRCPGRKRRQGRCAQHGLQSGGAIFQPRLRDLGQAVDRSIGCWFRTGRMPCWSWARRSACRGRRPSLSRGCVRVRAAFPPANSKRASARSPA
jgi:hypothetical protein